MRIRIILYFFFIILLASCKKDNSNRTSNADYQLVFTEQLSDSIYQLVKINDDGSDKTTLSSSNSPYNTGKIYNNKFLYITNIYSDTNSIYTFDLTTNTSTYLHSSPDLYFGSLSADATKAAFFDNANLSIINTNGTGYNKLPFISSGDGDGAIVFSHNNSKIYFLKYAGPGYLQDLCTVDSDGNNLVIVATHLYQDWLYGGFSINNNDEITYVRDDNDKAIQKVATNGSINIAIYTAAANEYVDSPIWSNGDDKIVFTLYDANGIANVCLINQDGTVFKKLTTNSSPDVAYTGYEWSPGDNKIVYVEQNSNWDLPCKLIVYTFSNNSFTTITNNAVNKAYWIK